MSDYQDDVLELMSKPVLSLTERERHERRMQWFVGEIYRQSASRAKATRCEAYYDQKQIDPIKRQEIESRGQTVVQHDQITAPIDWLLGTERHMRVDFKVDPRATLDETATTDADNKTALMKWIDDTNRTGYQRSAVWDDCMKAGIGWLEIFAKRDDGVWSVGKAHVPWRHVVHDSLGFEKYNPQGMRFLFRIKAIDVDIAIKHFPKKKAEILRCAASATELSTLQTWMTVPGQMIDLDSLIGRAETDPDQTMSLDMFNARHRVLLVECWALEPYEGEDDSTASLDDPIRMRPRVSIMTEYDTLYEEWSPYKHDRIPFSACVAYVDKQTGLPYSPIARMLDKQDAINKAMSRGLHDISTSQTHMEAGAIDEKVMKLENVLAELDDPGGVPLFKDGALTNGKVKTVSNSESAIRHIEFAQHIQTSMQQNASVNRETTGGGTGYASSRALGHREDQSSTQTAELFDNMMFFREQEGEITLAIAEQYSSTPMAIPTRDSAGNRKMIGLNQPRRDGSGFDNDITQLRARFVITEQPWRAALGQAQFESLMLVMKDLAGTAPQIVLALLDVVFEFSDIPNKQQIIDRIRSVTGQQAPDQKPTPDQIKMQQQKAALADASFQKQLAEMIADAHAAGAKSTQLQADTWVKRLEALALAGTAALQASQNPQLTPATDALLATVGFVDNHPAAGQTPATMPTNLPQLTQPAVSPTIPPRAPQPIAMMTPPRPAPLPYPGSA